MILIEALNIKSGGGSVLLKYFLESTIQENTFFKALLNDKIDFKINHPSITYHKASLLNKDRILKKSIELIKPSVVFCFGNLPPNFKYKEGKVITFFQNAHLLGNMDHSQHTLLDKLRYKVLKTYIKNYLNNSNLYIFQTDFIRKNFIKQYNYNQDNCETIPFFDLEELKNTFVNRQDIKEKQSFIYVSNDAPHKNHIMLFKAWKKLITETKYNPKLYLTIPRNNVKLCRIIDELNQKGALIENLGIVRQDVAWNYTSKCEFTVFPSLSETIGLGIIEAAILKTKVISSEMDYVREVIEPSLTFNPFDVDSMVEALSTSLEGNKNLPETKVVLENKICELVKILTSYRH